MQCRSAGFHVCVNTGYATKNKPPPHVAYLLLRKGDRWDFIKHPVDKERQRRKEGLCKLVCAVRELCCKCVCVGGDTNAHHINT